MVEDHCGRTPPDEVDPGRNKVEPGPTQTSAEPGRLLCVRPLGPELVAPLGPELVQPGPDVVGPGPKSSPPPSLGLKPAGGDNMQGVAHVCSCRRNPGKWPRKDRGPAGGETHPVYDEIIQGKELARGVGTDGVDKDGFGKELGTSTCTDGGGMSVATNGLSGGVSSRPLCGIPPIGGSHGGRPCTAPSHAWHDEIMVGGCARRDHRPRPKQ